LKVLFAELVFANDGLHGGAGERRLHPITSTAIVDVPYLEGLSILRIVRCSRYIMLHIHTPVRMMGLIRASSQFRSSCNLACRIGKQKFNQIPDVCAALMHVYRVRWASGKLTGTLTTHLISLTLHFLEQIT
jgi:hypothetical protein